MPPGQEREARALFLERSIARRTRTRWAGAIVGLFIVGMFVIGWCGFIQQRHKEHLSAWALPSDLYTYQRQLKALHITGPVSHLRWLKAELTTLAMFQSALKNLTTLPPTLTELQIWGDPSITSLTGLEKLPQLAILDLSHNSQLTSLAGLGRLPQLTTLKLGSTRITSLAGLEKLPQLTTLQLSGTGLTSLAGLEKLSQLTTLDLRGTGITRVCLQTPFRSLYC